MAQDRRLRILAVEIGKLRPNDDNGEPYARQANNEPGELDMIISGLDSRDYVVEHRFITLVAPSFLEDLGSAVERNDFVVALLVADPFPEGDVYPANRRFDNGPLPSWNEQLMTLGWLSAETPPDRLVVIASEETLARLPRLRRAEFIELAGKEYSYRYSAVRDEVVRKISRHIEAVGPKVELPAERRDNSILQFSVGRSYLPQVLAFSGTALSLPLMVSVASIFSVPLPASAIVMSAAIILAIALSGTTLMSFLLRRSAQSNSEYQWDYVAHEISAMRRNATDMTERLASFRPAFQDSLPAPIVAQIGDTVSQALTRRPAVGSTTDRSSAGSIVRELNHALQTPLSQISVATVNIMRDGGDTSEGTENHKSLSRIRDSVEICNSFLSAYRQVTSIQVAAGGNALLLHDRLVAAHAVYAGRAGISSQLALKVPKNVPGFSGDYVLAVLLPLLENAVEAARPGTTIEVSHSVQGDTHRLVVRSEPEELPVDQDIYNDGFTTKLRHQGLGLSTVRRLISPYASASLSHECKPPFVEFVATLPGRKA